MTAAVSWVAVGRPLTLDEQKIEQFREALTSGAFVDECAEAVGVGKRTAERWRQRGEAARAKSDAGEELDGDDVLYLKFYETCRQARAEAVLNAHKTIRRNMETNWRAAAWYLMIVDPERYATRHRRDSELPTPEQVGRMAVESGDVPEHDVKAVVTVLRDYMEQKRAGKVDPTTEAAARGMLSEDPGNP